MPNISKVGAGTGLTFESEVARFVVNESGGLSLGDIVELELVGTTYTKVSKTDGTTADRLPGALIGVATEGGSDGDSIRIGLRGVFLCACASTMDTGVSGQVQGGGGGGSGRLTALPAFPGSRTAYCKLVAVALEDTNSGGDLTRCLFDGITGIGGTSA